MAVPVVQDWTVNDSGGSTVSTLTLTKPTGATINDDDLHLVIVGSDDSFSADKWSKTGWTKLGEWGGSTPDCHLAVFYRLSDGTEGATEDFTHDTPDELFGWWLHITGNDTTTPIDVTGTAVENSSASSHVIPGVTTTINDCLAFYALAFDGGDGTPFGQPTGWTEQDEQTSGTTSTDACGVWGTKTQATAGGTGDATVSSNVSDGAAGIQFAIRTADPGAGGITGDVASTLVAPSQASTARAGVTGDTGSVLSPSTQSLAAVAAITGDATHLLAPATQVSTARADITGDIVQTLQAASQTLTGTVTTPGISGDIASVLAAPTQSGQARADITGNVTSTLVPASLSGAARANITGDAAQALQAPSQSLSATAGESLTPVTGDVASTITAPSQSGSAVVSLTGGVASVLIAPSHAVTGSVDVAGDVAQALQGPSQALSATVDRGDKTGDVASTLAAPTASLEARTDVTGEVSSTLQVPGLSVDASVALPSVAGDVSSALAGPGQHVTALKTGDTGPDALKVPQDDRVIEILAKSDDRTAEVPLLRESDIT